MQRGRRLTCSGGDVTGLLRAWGRGDHAALDELWPLVHGELRRRAAAYLRQERPGHTLEPTALVHEAYLRLVGQVRVGWQDRKHFFALAAQMMRRILVDHARGQRRKKRAGSAVHVTLDEAVAQAGPSPATSSCWIRPSASWRPSRGGTHRSWSSAISADSRRTRSPMCSACRGRR